MTTCLHEEQVSKSCVTHTASEIIGLPTPNLSDLNKSDITHVALTIPHDLGHPPNPFTLLPSGPRYRTLRWL